MDPLTNGLVDVPAKADGAPVSAWDLVIADLNSSDMRWRQAEKSHHTGADLYEHLLAACVHQRAALHAASNPRIDAVYLDLDGVLVNFRDAALRAHGKPGLIQTPGEWHIEKELKVTPKEFWSRCQGFDFWYGMEPLPDAWPILESVIIRFPQSQVWLASSPADDPQCLAAKYAWVGKHLEGWSRRLLLMPDKTPLARPGAFLFDDSDHNVNAFIKAGGEAALVPRPWNSGHHHAIANPDLPARLVSMKMAQLARRLSERQVAA